MRRYFSVQSGSHGFDRDGMVPPLFKHGARCGSLAHAQLMPRERLLREAVTVSRPGEGGPATVTLFAHDTFARASACLCSTLTSTCSCSSTPLDPVKRSAVCLERLGVKPRARRWQVRIRQVTVPAARPVVGEPWPAATQQLLEMQSVDAWADPIILFIR